MFSNLASLNSLRSVSMSSSKKFFTTIFSPLDGNSAVKTVEKPPRPISSLFLSSLNLKIGTLKRTCVYCECDLKSEHLKVNVSN